MNKFLVRYSRKIAQKHLVMGAMADSVSRAIKKADAVVMANHGLVVVGNSLKDAYRKTLEIETKAKKLLWKKLR